jgi:hypothetical protein|tara:strand:- start:397 stop:708 length:312 start_codon:yes stop_codon:yes gene_type:complete
MSEQQANEKNHKKSTVAPLTNAPTCAILLLTKRRKKNHMNKNIKKPSLTRKLKPYYSYTDYEDGTRVERWAKKNTLGDVIEWTEVTTNPFGEKLTEVTPVELW